MDVGLSTELRGSFSKPWGSRVEKSFDVPDEQTTEKSSANSPPCEQQSTPKLKSVTAFHSDTWKHLVPQKEAIGSAVKVR